MLQMCEGKHEIVTWFWVVLYHHKDVILGGGGRCIRSVMEVLLDRSFLS